MNSESSYTSFLEMFMWILYGRHRIVGRIFQMKHTLLSLVSSSQAAQKMALYWFREIHLDWYMVAEHLRCYTADSDGYDIWTAQNIHELCTLHIGPSPQYSPSYLNTCLFHKGCTGVLVIPLLEMWMWGDINSVFLAYYCLYCVVYTQKLTCWISYRK